MPSVTPQDETDAVIATVQRADRMQSNADGFAELLTADAAIVNFAGRRVAGRERIRGAMRDALRTPLADVRTRTEVADVRFPAPGTALVNAPKYIFDGRADAEDLGGDRGNLTFVLVKTDGQWRIALAQTTPIRV
jgi:uncharacterized protein (TIGR02246 family)